MNVRPSEGAEVKESGKKLVAPFFEEGGSVLEEFVEKGFAVVEEAADDLHGAVSS